MIEPTKEQELFAACLDLLPAERTAFLDRECGDDAALRDRLGRLLAAHGRAEHATLRPFDALPLGPMPDAIGPYTLIGVLGEGGMGVVYEAEQQHPIRRRVALKIMKPGMDTRQIVARFMAERQALAAMDHPFVAKVFDAGESIAGRPYFAMELVQGEPLLEYCERQRPSIAARVALFVRICQAVQHAHQKGVIHRDLKPSNLLVSRSDGDPVPKVIDFGIAKAVEPEPGLGTRVTRAEQTLGTPAYMSPEQAGLGGSDIDTRSDIYSLGVILYELLSGVLPVDPQSVGETAFLNLLAGGHLAPPRPSAKAAGVERIDEDLDWIVMKALEVERARRYDTAAALADDLTRYLNAEPVAARPPTLVYRGTRFVRRHRVQVAAAALAAVALVGGSAAALLGMVRATQAEAQARQDAATATQISDFLARLFGAADPNARRSTTLRELLDRAAARIEPDLKDQPQAQASLLETLSHVYGSLGLHREAIALAEKSIALSVADAETVKTADAALTLGRSAQALGDFARARQAFEQALAIRTRLVGETDRDVANILNNLGGLASQLDDHEGAIAAHTRALAIQERLYGPNDIAVTNSLRGLAIVYSRQHEYQKALALNRRMLAIQQRIYGDDHPVTASAFESVAWDLKDLHQLAEARPLAEQALAIREKALGPAHPQIAFSHSLLGELYEAEGKLDEAMRSHEKALHVREAALGADNPRTADTLTALAQLKVRLGHLDDAQKLFERSLQIFEKAYGPKHSKTLKDQQNLAMVREQRQGR